MAPFARWLRRGGLTLAVAIASLALVASFARTGGRYFYCEAMGVLESNPCQAHEARDRDRLPAATQRQVDCCKVVTTSSLPSATNGSAHAIAPAAWVANLPRASSPAIVTDGHVFGARSRHDSPTRAPPLASERRAELMVFLT